MLQNKVKIVILAAGFGKRMGSDLPKVLIELQNKTLIKHVLYSLEKIKSSKLSEISKLSKSSELGSIFIDPKPVIVVGYKKEMVIEHLGDNYDFAHQDEQLGTGHAVACAKEFFKDEINHIVVLYGDQPLVSSKTVENIVNTHLKEGKSMTMATFCVDDFEDWRNGFYDFGKIARDKDGRISRIIEKKDATEEEKEIKELNPALFCFETGWLCQNLEKLSNQNAQKEYYLTDLAHIAASQGEISSIEIDPREALGVNTREQLDLISNFLKNIN